MIAHYGIYLIATLALVATPGADIAFILGQGTRLGRAAALRAVVGICAGYLVHTTLAVVGVAALIASSPPAFTALRWAGTAYLLLLAIRALASRGGLAHAAAGAGQPSLAQGAATSLLNPKGLMLYLALLPQFVVPGADVHLALAILGLTHVALCAAFYGLVALAAARIGRLLQRSARAAATARAITATALLASAGRVAAG